MTREHASSEDMQRQIHERDERDKAFAKAHGIEIDGETFVVPIFDEAGKEIARSHFMRWKKIPWESGSFKDSLDIEACVEATKHYGLAIHRGEITLYEAAKKIQNAKK